MFMIRVCTLKEMSYPPTPPSVNERQYSAHDWLASRTKLDTLDQIGINVFLYMFVTFSFVTFYVWQTKTEDAEFTLLENDSPPPLTYTRIP